MSLAVRRTPDAAPQLPLRTGMTIERVGDAATMAALQNRSIEDMERRFADGHRAYVALVDGAPAAFGWVATRKAEIGEFGSAFVNAASAAGIHKAGFTTVAAILVDRAGNPWPCWRCARTSGEDASCRTTRCCCDYQNPREVCNANAV